MTGVQRDDGGTVDTPDPVVGRAVDLWGHHNPYLGTTVNRARVFDVDPSSAWTTTLMGGRFAFGRDGRSHDVGYLCVGEVTGFMPPRWHGFTPVRRTLHQFAIAAGEGLDWPSGSADSPPYGPFGPPPRPGTAAESSSSSPLNSSPQTGTWTRRTLLGGGCCGAR